MRKMLKKLPPLVIALGIASTPYLFVEGAPALLKWWVVMLASGIAIAGLFIKTVWRRSGMVAALMLVGFSAQLCLTYPIWFQQIKLSSSSSFSYVLYLTITVQAGAATWLLVTGGGLSRITGFIKVLGYQRVLVFGVLMLGVSASAMTYIDAGNPAGYLEQVALGSAFQILNMLTLVVLVQSLPLDAFSIVAKRVGSSVSLLQVDAAPRPLDRWIPVLTATWVLIASGLFAVFAFQQVPHVPDEVAYLLQAKYFLHGELFVPIPPSLDALGYEFFDSFDGKWFSIFPPGWPLVLAIGVFLDVPWIINPLLAAASILLAHVFFRRIATTGVANVAILLMAVSPWFIETSASIMSHTLTLFLMLAAWVLLLLGRDKKSSLAAVAAGGLMGFLFLTRPLDGLIAGTMTGLWCLFHFRAAGSWRVVVGYCLGCLAVGSIIFEYNQTLTGDFLASPINQYFDAKWAPDANRLGFGADIGPPNRWNGIDLYRGHSFKEAIIIMQHNAYSLNFEFIGIVLGSLWLLFIHMVWGRWNRNDFYMVAFCTATVGTLSLYWFSGSFYIGPRYWFLIFLPLVALTVRGIGTLAQRVDGLSESTLSMQKLGLVIIAIGVISMTSFLTWRGVTRFHEFRGFHTDYRVILEKYDLKGALIFVKTRSASDFASAYMHNSLDFKSDSPIFARDLGRESNKAVSNAFPNRPVYFMVGRISRGGKARIVKWPAPERPRVE